MGTRRPDLRITPAETRALQEAFRESGGPRFQLIDSTDDLVRVPRLEALERFATDQIEHYRNRAAAWCIVACVLVVISTVEAIALRWLP
jgi:hypothetical protein